MASAANYLKRHGWEKGNVAQNKKAIFAYNRSDDYVLAVLAYANAINFRFDAASPKGRFLLAKKFFYDKFEL